MQEWDCTVRMPSNYLQHMIVEAYNYNDARSIAESSTGGKLINATPKYGAEISDDNSSNSSSSLDGAGILFFLVIAFCIAAWKYILLIGGLALLLWILWKNWN
jgi:hypothetical protein